MDGSYRRALLTVLSSVAGLALLLQVASPPAPVDAPARAAARASADEAVVEPLAQLVVASLR